MSATRASPFHQGKRLAPLLLRSSLIAAFLVVICLTLVKSYYAINGTRAEITADGERLLAMFENSAAQAVYMLDPLLADQVATGIFQHSRVAKVTISLVDDPSFSSKMRTLQFQDIRHITDFLFGTEYPARKKLTDSRTGAHYGDLEIILDTAPYGKAFLDDWVLTLIFSLMFALLLVLIMGRIYRRTLVRPLETLVDDMNYIDPEFPGRYQLQVSDQLRGSELDEWVERINLLLKAIEFNNDMRKEAEESLERMSLMDVTTGLPSRQGLQSRLDSLMIKANELEKHLAVFCVALDDFKSINDQHSFQVGDQLLRAFAERMNDQFGEHMQGFARLGGDQFVIVQSGLEHAYQAAVLAQKILFVLQQPLQVELADGRVAEIKLGATIGITLYPGEDGNCNGGQLLQRAEQTMQLAKMSSKGKYRFYMASIDSELRQRRQLEDDLKHAIEANELSLVYQPQIDYKTGRVIGAEALLRWNSARHGFVSPDQFIPIAEQNGSIIAIGQWVLETACQQIRQWLDEGLQDFRIAVNLSAVQLHHSSLIGVIEGLLHSHAIPQGYLELEITETSIMDNIELVLGHLEALRNLGLAIAIDDFGTGHSSLGYLKKLPLDKIKIDRSFVQDVVTSEDDATIARTVIQLGHSLDFKVLAEGVETVDHERLLIDWGCDEAQGYLYSKPVPAHDLTRLLGTTLVNL